jgi:hypothetical protein
VGTTQGGVLVLLAEDMGQVGVASQRQSNAAGGFCNNYQLKALPSMHCR